MFINQHMVIAIVFRLINFFIVVGLAIYIFKKYVMPTLLILMARKDAEKEFFVSQQVLLEQKQHELDVLIKRDVVQCENLKVKIDEWRIAVDKQRAIQEKDRMEMHVVIEGKNNKKMQLQEDVRVQKIVIEKVVAGLSLSLISYFQQQEHGDVYCQSILSFMNERL